MKTHLFPMPFCSMIVGKMDTNQHLYQNAQYKWSWLVKYTVNVIWRKTSKDCTMYQHPGRAFWKWALQHPPLKHLEKQSWLSAIAILQNSGHSKSVSHL